MRVLKGTRAGLSSTMATTTMTFPVLTHPSLRVITIPTAMTTRFLGLEVPAPPVIMSLRQI